MKCKHQFIKARDSHIKIHRPYSTEEIQDGVEVICALCGDRKIIKFDGTILVYSRKKEEWLKNENTNASKTNK